MDQLTVMKWTAIISILLLVWDASNKSITSMLKIKIDTSVHRKMAAKTVVPQ